MFFFEDGSVMEIDKNEETLILLALSLPTLHLKL